MPASTIDQIFRLEDNFVFAALAVFNADSLLGSIAYGLRPVEGLPKSRLEVEASGFAKASEQQIYAQGRHWDSHFSGPVRVTVITLRADPTAAATHSLRVGRVRYLMTPKAASFTSANLPYAEVLSIEQVATTHGFDEPTDTDRTELEFQVHLGLLPTAFPA